MGPKKKGSDFGLFLYLLHFTFYFGRRGKMSEGVSFNDDYARGVICVGVPFPNSYDRSISAKMSYNNEQRKLRKRGVLTGNEWYSQQAYRALGQAIGR